MNPRSASSMFAAACVAAASAAHALPLTDRASFELFTGSAIGTQGTYRDSFHEPVDGGAMDFNKLGFDDVYRHGYSAGAEFDYAVDSNFTAFARAAYSQLNGMNREVGSLNGADGHQPIDARFGDADSREVDVGARYMFAAGEKWRPFLGGAIGMTRLSSTSALVSEPGGAPTTRVELGRESTEMVERVETGLEFSPMHNVDLRLTAAASHIQSGRPSGDPNLALLGLDEDNRSVVRGHWDFPAEIGAVWHF
jgi:opacity protein-like surface antigen